jgi:hypothetical protein
MTEQRCQFCGGRVEAEVTRRNQAGWGFPGMAGQVQTVPAACVECGERPRADA